MERTKTNTMFVFNKFASVLGVLLVLKCFTLSSGIPAYQEQGLLSDEEKRGATIDIKHKFITNKEDLSAKATSKRGLPPIIGEKRYFGGSPTSYGDYEPGRYGGSGGGYPNEDRRPLPPIYESGDRYHHSGGGYIGRPSGHGYGPDYGPPMRPPYYGPEDDNYYHDHGGSGYDMANFKSLGLKKILLPLAGLAILGVAAAASQNPVFLPLGSVSGRRKRSLPLGDTYPLNPIVKPLKTF